MPTSAWDNRRVSLYRDEGVVLRTHKLGEADRIVTLLTRAARPGARGRARAYAAPAAAFGARLEPFSHVDVQLYAGRTLDVVTQVETLGGVRRDRSPRLRPLHRGQAMLETAERLTAGGEASPRCSSSCCSSAALRALASGEHDPALVLDAFLLRSLSVAGWAPTLRGLRALRHDPARTARSHVAGRRRRSAPDCRQPGSATPAPDDARAAVGAAHRRLGHRRRQRRAAAAGGAAAWSPRTCSGTSSAACARCPSSSGSEPRPPEYATRRRTARSRRRRTRPAPGRRRSRPSWCRGTSRWSWTATGGGPTTAGCRAPRGTRPARRALLDVVHGRHRARHRLPLGVRVLHRELAPLARTRCAS